ncbi:MAG: E3 binding domain-containing protein, partial [Spirochaetaceae bacterium]|nr:E3 binding domain-containing protein [Spirochaetaceae bacterium]
MPPAAGPAARRLARQRGLDLQRVHGSGHRGRITVEDVAQDLPAQAAALPVTARVDLSDLLDRLPALASLSGRHAPLTPLLIKAAAVALRVSPDLAPLSVSKGTERWALDHRAVAASLRVAP